MDNRRVISTQVQEEDVKVEKSLRPLRLDDYIGQAKAKENKTYKLKFAVTLEDAAENAAPMYVTVQVKYCK